jgi:hypothetical protein
MADTNHPETRRPHDGSKESHPAYVPDTGEHVTAHEESDVNVRAIMLFLLALLVIGIVIHIGLWGLMHLYARQMAVADPRQSPLAIPAGTLPPGPRLLTDEPAALRALHEEEDALLADIDRAKQAVVDAGLPARADGVPPASTPSGAASRMDSSSGRKQ